MKKLFALLLLAGLLVPVVGCSVDADDDDNDASLKVKVDD